MTHTIYQVDSFSSQLFKGNPAAVIILEKWLSDGMMQNIAMENNLSETAFVAPHKSELYIRWFTPTTEVDLCGHATLAAAHVLFNHEDYEGFQVTFHSKSGPLTVEKIDEELVLDFPMDTFRKVDELPLLLKMNLKDDVTEIYKGKNDYMFVFEDQKHIKNFYPEFNMIELLDSRGLIITAPGEECDFVSRYFAPQYGIPEDPVTGSTHTLLTPYWGNRLGKTKLSARQLSKRGGKLKCSINGSRVLIGGYCKTFFKGILSL